MKAGHYKAKMAMNRLISMIISFLNSNQEIFHQKIFIANVSTTVLWSSSGHIKYRLGIHYKYRKLYANDQK